MPFVVTTDRKDFKPLGRRADYAWEVLRDRLARDLGSEYGLLLAEPVTDTARGRMDWHADFSGSAIPMFELDADRAAALHDRLHAMRTEIHALAERIETPPPRGEGDKGLAGALRRATVVPDEKRYVWSVGGKPLLVNWGMVYLDDDRPEHTVIGEGLVPRLRRVHSGDSVPQTKIAAPVVVPPAPQNRFAWPLLLWPIFVVLIGAIYFLLLEACGIFVAPENSLLHRFLPSACQASALANPYADLLARRRELEAEIRKAELDLARLNGDCAPAEHPAHPPTQQQAQAPPPPPREPPGPSIQERLDRERAQTGQLQISLAWNGLEDLDLHVQCPGGELYHANKVVCGGNLDVDMNNEKNNVDAVENAAWADPPQGHYKISVTFFGRKGQPERSVPFIVRVKRGTSAPQTFNGTMSSVNETKVVHEFDL